MTPYAHGKIFFHTLNGSSKYGANAQHKRLHVEFFPKIFNSNFHMALSPEHKSLMSSITYRVEINVSPAVWVQINEKSSIRPSSPSININLEKYNSVSFKKWQSEFAAFVGVL